MRFRAWRALSYVNSAQLSPQVTKAFSSAAQQALGRDFVTSVERILFFNVGFWALTGLLSMLLPRVRPQPVVAAHAA